MAITIKASRRHAPASDRSSLVLGVDKPTLDNTGLLPSIARTDYNSPSYSGTTLVTVAAGTYANQNFYGDISLSGSGTWTFDNCRFIGGTGHPSGNRGIVGTSGITAGGWATFTDCEIYAQSPSYFRDGINGHRFTVRRCYIHNVNDAIGSGAGTAGGIIEQNLLGPLEYWSQDPAHGDGTHNDGIQIQGGGPWTIRGNMANAYNVNAAGSTVSSDRPVSSGAWAGYYYGGSGIILNQNTGAIDGTTLIEKNWLAGGYAQLQINRGSTYDPIQFTLGENWYSRDVYDNYPANPDKRWICLVPSSGTITDNGGKLYTEQRWDDDLTLLTAGRASGIRTV